MTTYSAAAVSDATIAFQKPITLQQGRALRDNPVAIAEGAVGAPRIQGAAHPQFSPGVVVLDALQIAGQEHIIFHAGGGGVGTEYQYPHIFTPVRGATLQAYVEMKADTGSTARFAVFVNGLLVAEETTTSTSYVSKFINFPYNAGEQVHFRFGLDFDNSDSYAWFRTLRIMANQLGTYRT